MTKPYQTQIGRKNYLRPAALEALKDCGPAIGPVRAYIAAYKAYEDAQALTLTGTQRISEAEEARLAAIRKAVEKGQGAELIWQTHGQSHVPMPNGFAEMVADACLQVVADCQDTLMRTIRTRRKDILDILHRRPHHDTDIAIDVVENKR